MAIVTYEGIVEGGQIRLREGIKLPERAKVFVLLPDLEAVPQAHLHSPRLVDSTQAADFVKEIIEIRPDAEL